MNPRHLYVHAPFCARRCSYCDFAVHVAAEPPVEAWATAIGGEARLLARAEGWGRLPLDTLYVGGGTPSLLGRGAMARLRDALEPVAALDDVAEFTVEANPESFDEALAVDWVEAGVDRVSFGTQSFDAGVLRWMGRLHGPEGPERAVAAARAADIGNISVDLIFGLPARLGRDLSADLDGVLALEPEHVSVYGLTAEKGTPLGRWVESGRERMPDEDGYGEEYLLVAERLGAAGYIHYEVSNFARPGRESRHNAAYWRGVPYVGLGSGAHSFVPPRRWWNPRDWFAYRSEVAAGRLPRAAGEEVTDGVGRLERLWLGLRTRDGLERSELDPAQAELVRRWELEGWAEDDADRVRLTARGWLLLDRLTVELDAAAAAPAGDCLSMESGTA